MAENDNRSGESSSESKQVKRTLSSSEDEETENLPKIINTVSLQGCTELEFQNGAENGDNASIPDSEVKSEAGDSESASGPKAKKKLFPEKKKVKLTHLGPATEKLKKSPKPSTSKRENVVDARRLALQENLFKTKELFDTFLRVCQDQESSEQMNRVIEKLMKAYGLTRQEYLGSPEFHKILESETEKVNTSNTKPWLNLKLVMDELKHNKTLATPKFKLGESEESQDNGAPDEDEPVIECPKKRQHLKKLEKTLRALNLKIKKLEEKEVDLDDDDSSYIKLDRYRAQFTKIYNKVCEIRGKLADADRPYLRKVSFAGTTYPHINRCIERYYNKHREFPDFQDIKKLVTIALKQEGIEMQPIKIHQMATDAFKEFGEMLKRLRQYDDYDIIVSYLDQQVDPARDDEQLAEQLNKNALLFKKREQEVLDKFAAQDAGLQDSGEDSDNKPKKKNYDIMNKRKIMTIVPKDKKVTPKPSRNLSSSESSDEEESTPKTVKKRPAWSGSSSGSEDSGSGAEEAKKKTPSVGKGKTLVGKKRFVKRGPRASPKKARMPKAMISSDEESTPKDTKDTLTNYLGLQGTRDLSPKVEEKVKTESDEDVKCVNDVKWTKLKRSPIKQVKSDSESDSKETLKPPPVVQVDIKSGSESSDEKHNGTTSQQSALIIEDNSGDSEPIAIEEKIVSPRKSPVKITPPLRSVTKNSWKSDSSDERTSDDESEKKTASDVVLTPQDLSLSPDSSDSEVKQEEKKSVSDVDDSIEILSEEITEIPVEKPAKNGELANNSDSDDICIVSSQETRTVAPRKLKPEHNVASNYWASQKASANISQRRPLAVTSTPERRPKLSLKRNASSHLTGSHKKLRRGSTSSSDSVSSRSQPLIKKVINGAARKTMFRLSHPASNTESIPLIELD